MTPPFFRATANARSGVDNFSLRAIFPAQAADGRRHLAASAGA
jgi:hypothetical protein